MVTQFDSNSFPPEQRIDAWQDAVATMFLPLEARTNGSDGFRVKVDRLVLGPVLYARNLLSPQSLLRTQRQVSHADDDRGPCIIVALLNQGEMAIVQDGHETRLRAGQFTLFDTGRPYERHMLGDTVQTLFCVRKTLLNNRIDNLDALVATAFGREHPLGGITFDLLTGIAETGHRVAPETGERISIQALDILTLALSERVERAPDTPSAHRSLMRLRILNYIQQHLANPELSIAMAARGVGISSRYVRSLLADQNTSFRHHVLTLRLEHCRRALACAANAHRLVGEIAYSWGFNDLAHFSRAFRRQFALSPREWRQLSAKQQTTLQTGAT
jgi:AraC-like DNA-binding protein